MRGDTVDFSRASVWAEWVSRLGEEHRAAAESVWDRLKRLASVGWLPMGVDDPIILEAFREGRFPEDSDASKSGETSGPE
jgi:hypothetical protein